MEPIKHIRFRKAECEDSARFLAAGPKDAHGVYRIAGSRVTLDLVVRAFNRGATAEEIAQDFPSLQLSDVYQVIGYYLKHGPELAQYFEEHGREEQTLLANHEEEWSPRGLRERLLARRKNR